MSKGKLKIEDEREERCFVEEYKNWRKSVPFTYEMVMTHALHWPSQSFEWLDCDVGNDDAFKSKFLVSSITGMDKAHILSYDVYLPDPKEHLESFDDKVKRKTNKDRNEPFGVYKPGLGKCIPRQRIVIGGKSVNVINNVRYFTNDRVLVSTYSKSKDNYDLVMYDMNRDGWLVNNELEDLTALTEEEASPVARFRGFSGRQFELNSHKNPLYIAGAGLKDSENKSGVKGVNIWSLETAQHDYIVHPITQLGTGSNLDARPETPVNSVSWWETRQNCILAGKDGVVMLWDLRAHDRSHRPLMQFQMGYSGFSANGDTCVSPSPFSNFVLAAASAGRPALFDLRNTERRLHTFGLPGEQRGIKHGVHRLRWSPHFENLLACSTDSDSNKIVLYDLSILRDESRMEESRSKLFNGVLGGDIPELVFSHSGHSATITDFNWNRQIPGLIGSTALDNIVQIWKPLENLVPLPVPDYLKVKTEITIKDDVQVKEENIIEQTNQKENNVSKNEHDLQTSQAVKEECQQSQ